MAVVTLIDQAIAAGVFTVVVTHNLGTASHAVVGVEQSWLTARRWRNKQANTVEIDFEVAAPTGGGTYDVEVRS